MNGGLRVHRSLLRTLLVFVAGLVLVLTAIDVVAAHVVSSPPETDPDTGALTSRGLNQRRSDFTWGWSLLLLGSVLTVGSATSAVARRPVLVVDDDGLRLRIAGPRRFVTVPWEDISWVHTSADGHDEVVPPRVFLLHVRSKAAYPAELWGAGWDGATLVVDADSWNRRPEDVATHVDLALETWRRQHQPQPDELGQV